MIDVEIIDGQLNEAQKKLSELSVKANSIDIEEIKSLICKIEAEVKEIDERSRRMKTHFKKTRQALDRMSKPELGLNWVGGTMIRVRQRLPLLNEEQKQDLLQSIGRADLIHEKTWGKEPNWKIGKKNDPNRS